ncbi:MAG: prolipoprotein diacylglyceryl transferase [Planctomycetota bacterium]
MHPFLHIPIGVGFGLVLLALGALWFLYWGRGADPDGLRKHGAWGLLGLPLVIAALVRGAPLHVVRWPTYGLMMLIGASLVVLVGARWAKQRGLRPDLIAELGLCGLVFGLLGARAVHLIENWDVKYADRPPAMACPGALEALAPGDELRLRTSAGEATVRFQGGETTTQQLAARIEQDAAGVGVFVKPMSTRHRGPEGVVEVSRGFLLKTRARGQAALLEVRGGSAAPKLGLAVGYTRGEDVPLRRIFDLSAGGLTYFGSVFGVLLSCSLWLRYRGVRPLVVLDVMAPVLPLGLFFGRLGCLAYGCCWGRELPGGVSFPPGSLAWQQFAAERTTCADDRVLAALGQAAARGPVERYDQLVARVAEARPALAEQARALAPKLQGLLEGTPPLHPAQLYEGLGVLAIVVFLYVYRQRWQRRLGQVFALVFLTQAPLRFAVEHLRRDHDVFFRAPGLPYVFTESQSVAVLLFAGALPAFWWLSTRGEPLEASPGAPARDTPASDAPAADDAQD